LTKSSWETASLRDVLFAELEPFREGKSERFTIKGKDVQLASQMVLALGLVFHELVTNAVKHGALSLSDGRVEIGWKNEGDRLHLHWIESGGPPVQKPTRRGLGTRVIESGLMSQFGGKARIDFDPSGVQCFIDLPVARQGDAS
jgi:two-component sensor histidine kinase